MKFAAAVLVLILVVGCEKQPTPEEIQQRKDEELARATPTPRPPLNDLKNYKSPLEQSPKR